MASIRVLKRKTLKDAYQVNYHVSQEKNPLTNETTYQRAQKQFDTKKEALIFKAKVEKEYHENVLLKPSRETVTHFLYRWIEIYAKEKDWSPSTYQGNLGLIQNHIIPILGGRPIQKLTPQEIDIFFVELKDKKVMPKGRKKLKSDEDLPCLASKTRREIYNVLKSAFNTAKRWKLIDQELVTCKRPSAEKKEVLSWDKNGIHTALDSIQDKQMHLAVHMAFACTMRIGEVVGLQWKHIDLENDKIYVRQILQRVTKEALKVLNPQSVFFRFPEQVSNSKSVLVLKEPKTISSIRDLHIPKELKKEILAWKEQQEKDKAYYGNEYTDYQLMFCTEQGKPKEVTRLSGEFRSWQKEHDTGLDYACFHSLRHSSITTKLKASAGDIKSVQADSGHSSADMILNVYAHAQEEDKKEMSKNFEKTFYGAESSAKDISVPEEDKLNVLLDECKKNPELLKQFLISLGVKPKKRN